MRINNAIIGFRAENLLLSEIRYDLRKDYIVCCLSDGKTTYSRVIVFCQIHHNENVTKEIWWKSLGALPESEEEVNKLQRMIEPIIDFLYKFLNKEGPNDYEN